MKLPSVMNVVQLHGLVFSSSSNMIAFFMERYDSSIDEFLRENCEYCSYEGMDILRKVAECLRYVHSEEVVHLDLHAGNVLIRSTSQGHEVAISDFGFAKKLGYCNQSIEINSCYVLNDLIVPPECRFVKNGQVSLATDIYAFGILIWQILTRQNAAAIQIPGTSLGVKLRKEQPGSRLIDEYCEEFKKESLFNSFTYMKSLKEILDVMNKCLAPKPEGRFKAKDLCFVLEPLSTRDSGVYVYFNGDLYEGDFCDNQFHGVGSLWLACGDVYRGELEGGKPHGQGSLEFHDGGLYSGYWKQGNRDGLGTLLYSNGDILRGQWTNDEISEVDIYVFASGVSSPLI
eukprot:TRINITY_DN12753_c0_g1_i1.p1 TRINITY_DN12753_c0_g1~~TRINITY_DN12753_c0_g1_i1.p1  ORF type:complete len:344 (+),score=76.33 TRINITY_DN12753_c0_g1_i1:640-1671(+)